MKRANEPQVVAYDEEIDDLLASLSVNRVLGGGGADAGGMWCLRRGWKQAQRR